MVTSYDCSFQCLALQDQAYKHSISSCLFNTREFFDTNTVTMIGGTGRDLSSGCWRPQNMHLMPSSRNCWEWWVQIQIGYISEATLIKMHRWVGRGPTSQRGLTSFQQKISFFFLLLIHRLQNWQKSRLAHALVSCRDKQHRGNLQHFEANIGEKDNCVKVHNLSVTCSRTPGGLQCVTSETRLW